MKLALGTVQFGLNYGVSNKLGQTSQKEARKIWVEANSNGIVVVDTAMAYGNSESLIGQIIPSDQGKIVTKTPHFRSLAIGEAEVRLLHKSFSNSLLALNRKSIYALLVHNAKDLLKPGGNKLFEALRILRDGGYVKKIGVSAYSGADIDGIIKQFPIDLVQVPLNILDQRLIKGGQLQRLKERGVEIHARSAFLQGLLLMDETAWPKSFTPYFPILRRFTDRARELQINKLDATLGFVQSLIEVDHVVCGVNSLSQWKDLLNSAKTVVDPQVFTDLYCDDPVLVDPTRWGMVVQ